ncbi:MAG: methyltransferase domain-containing protein [Gammaproteobacteria bacterium]|nr:methyltransferase domain-containing protein [Gammaproteobacteria bacterium]
MNPETHVRERYTAGAASRQEELCCPVDYDPALLAALPAEIIDKDYGCGDPSRYVRPGDRVLDLGSGGGKLCYMAAQLVGPAGFVTGVDSNDDMLALARRYQPEMAARLGGERTRFLKGRIQDLALDLERLEAWLAHNTIRTSADLNRLKAREDELRADHPLIADASVDLVISNCVLNLVDDRDKGRLIREIRRVLRPGGRIAISDIVSDREVPKHLRRDPELWSGCISGAFEERAFLEAFVDAGFHAVRYDKWDPAPWREVEGIRFRAVTVTAVNPPAADDAIGAGSVFYRGPYAQVALENGRVFQRGRRTEVDAGLHALLTGGVYGEDFVAPDGVPASSGGGCGPRCC